MNTTEGRLALLLDEIAKPAFDCRRVERDLRDLAASLAGLSRATPRVELDRIAALHAALRALVETRRADTRRSLAAVLRARSLISCLTRPRDSRAVLDVKA